ncbi:restriction endonuclease [Gemmatimonadota bacterium]
MIGRMAIGGLQTIGDHHMNSEETTTVKRKGSMLEEMVENIFSSAGFDVKRNKYYMGYEIDVLASFGDRNIIIECKQYEKSSLTVRNLVLLWKGKNEIINADVVVLMLYGVNVPDEAYTLAEEFNIQIWGMDDLNSLLPLINQKDKLCADLIKKLDIKERDIADIHEKSLKELIWYPALRGRDITEDMRFERYRKILRDRLITNLKQYGSTPEEREQHVNYFEHVIKETKVKKVLIFKMKSKLSQRAIWEDTKEKLATTRPFDSEISSKYLGYMKRIEEGYKEYYQWFHDDKSKRHRRLISERLLRLHGGGHAQFKAPAFSQVDVVLARNNEIVLDRSNIQQINILEWILTDKDYEMVERQNEQGTTVYKMLHWYPTTHGETVEYVCRLFHEYFGVSPESPIVDMSLQ